MSIFSTSVTALHAAQVAIATTGHNIANANTVGYRRQETVIETNVAVKSGNGFIGQGANASTVTRVYNEFLERQVTQNESQSAYLDQYQQGIQQIDNIMGDRSAGFSSAIQKFFSTWNDLSNTPSSIPARQAVLGAANTVADNINGLGDYLQTLQDSVNVDVSSMVGKINSMAASIAQMNDRIASIQDSALQPPNDLLDQRDQLVSDLNKMAGVTVFKDSSTGNYNVFLGHGFQLVGGSGAATISANPSLYDPTRLEVFGANGSVQLSGNSGIIGGKLGGLLDYRTETLDMAQNSLGRIAMALSQNVNNQNQLGQDATGAAGGLIFTDPVSFPKAFAATNNTGTGVMSATLNSSSQLTTSDYQLAFDAGVYTLQRLSDGQSWSDPSLAALSTAAAQGFTLSLDSGAPNAGDTFLIRPTWAGSTNINVVTSDPLAIAAAAPVAAGTSTANTGNAKISQPVVDAATQPPLNPDLTSVVTFTFTGAGTFDVTGSGTGDPVGVAYTPGGNISYNGWTLHITGTPVAGDVFTIGPNVGGNTDNRNAIAMAALQHNKTLISGNSTLESGYATLVGNIGNKTEQVAVNQKAQKNLLDQATQAQQSASGVNLDEEAAALIRYQQAYQAAAKMIAAASAMFDTLLQI